MLKVSEFWKEERDPFFIRGMKKGVKKAELKAEKKVGLTLALKDRQFVINLLKQTDFTDEKIADIAAVAVKFVQQIREELTNPPKKRATTKPGKATPRTATAKKSPASPRVNGKAKQESK